MPEGDLHAYAVGAEENLEKLATGLAKEGASEETVKAVEQMADVCREIVKALGKGQEQTADEEGPPEEAEQPRSIDQAAAETEAEMQAAAQKRKQ